MKTIYSAANLFFFIFHIVLILFNLFGWIFPRFRKWNLITLGLTAFSWIVLGALYGFGYCFLTDWHWMVREQLGYETKSHSYIHFLITSLLPIQLSEKSADILTAILFLFACLASISVNMKTRRKHDHP